MISGGLTSTICGYQSARYPEAETWDNSGFSGHLWGNRAVKWQFLVAVHHKMFQGPKNVYYLQSYHPKTPDTSMQKQEIRGSCLNLSPQEVKSVYWVFWIKHLGKPRCGPNSSVQDYNWVPMWPAFSVSCLLRKHSVSWATFLGSAFISS